MSDKPKPTERPSQQELDLLLEKLHLRIEGLLRHNRCAPDTATPVLREAVLALAHRWSRVRDREQWLLDRIEKAVRRTVNLPNKELCDDEEPPS